MENKEHGTPPSPDPLPQHQHPTLRHNGCEQPKLPSVTRPSRVAFTTTPSKDPRLPTRPGMKMSSFAPPFRTIVPPCVVVKHSYVTNSVPACPRFSMRALLCPSSIRQPILRSPPFPKFSNHLHPHPRVPFSLSNLTSWGPGPASHRLHVDPQTHVYEPWDPDPTKWYLRNNIPKTRILRADEFECP